MTLYNEIINTFENLVGNHRYYRGFGHGSIEKIDAVVNHGYPLLFVRPLSSPGLTGVDGRQRELVFEIYSLDVPKLSDEDGRLVMSNTEQGLYDVYSYILDGPVQYDLQITMTNLVPLYEAFQDKALGWLGTFTVITDADGITYCNIPGNPTPTPTATPTSTPTATPVPTSTPTVTPTPTVSPTGIVTDQIAYFFNLETGSFVFQTGSEQNNPFGARRFWDYVLKDTITGSMSASLFNIESGSYTAPYISFNGVDESGYLRGSKDVSYQTEVINPVNFTNSSTTVEAWINHQSNQPNIFSVNESLVLNFERTTPRQSIGRRSGSQDIISAGYTPTGNITSSIVQDQFYHYANVYDRTNQTLYFYINGNLITSQSNVPANNYANADLHFAEDYNSSYGTTGDRRLQKIQLGNTRVYKKALSQAEIQQNYSIESASYA